ncbi:Peptidoglycan/LPS O-acetylase OafA/YrhL, contains acyltransferase and SGNH-hydrolase domains [Burkholderiales bacterium 8X]|nr:Peptidoglycan/LPS O-acetylase OafA/YrhL, contains acyltransferase and SGNH-hydrolase domains [Burkholderiales bacterium 8X]
MSAIALERSGTAPLPSHIAYRADIDGLRAVAVLAVLIFHAFPQYLPGGFVGVDVFFVISGFLITKVIRSNLERGTFTVRDFYARRVRRIFPALVLLLAVCLGFGWKTLLAEDLTQLAKHVFGGATFSSNILLWQEAGYFDKASESKPLLHLWSLGIEEQFYVVWPVLLWLGWRRVPPLVLIGSAILASFLWNVLTVGTDQTAAFYSPASRAWELLFGAALAYRKPFPKINEVQRDVASVAGIGLIAFTYVFISGGSRFPGWWALLPVLGTCLIIAAGPGALINRSLLSSRAMVGIGLISFPLYLWHWPLLTFGRAAAPDTDLGRVALLMTSVLFAWLTYQYLEKPLRFGGRSGVKTFALSGLLVLVGLSAALIFKQAGYPSRYPEFIRTATHYDLEGYRAGIRAGHCFTDADQTAPEIQPGCIDEGTGPLVMLWGDSGAASIYPGFPSDRKYRVAQVTSSACPPILDYAGQVSAGCRVNNQKARALVQSQAPQIVVLTAIWANYDASQLVGTIEFLKSAGVARVVVVGAVPAWKEPPSRTVFRLWKEDPLHLVPSDRLNYDAEGMFAGQPLSNPLAARSESLEPEMSQLAARASVEYVSAFDLMCEARRCLVRASTKKGEPYYLDQVHLNRTGAEFVVGRLVERLGLDRAP